MPTLKDALNRFKPELQKKIGDVEIDPIKDIIFTGTGLDYFQKTVKSKGVFSHKEGRNVFLANNLHGALGPALNRCATYHDEPAILVVNSQYNAPDFHLRREGVQKDIVCEQIPLEAIIAVYKTGKLVPQDLMMIDDHYTFLQQNCERVDFEI